MNTVQDDSWLSFIFGLTAVVGVFWLSLKAGEAIGKTLEERKIKA